MTEAERPRRVVIVGGGIAGLAAAYFLRDHACSVTVLESAPRLGGKLAISDVAGVGVDAGAEALLARRPEATGLITEIGLGGELVYPGTTTARIWTRGTFRSLPRRQFMGVPADLDELDQADIVSAQGMAAARQDAIRPATSRAGDVSVAEYVGERFGQEVVDRLVEPLLGGVYAGRPDQLSYDATLPALAQASLRYRSLAEAATSLLGPPTPGAPPKPVFTTLASGAGALPAALARASGAVISTGATVRGLARTATGWRLTVGPAIAPESVQAEAVILALPARPASRLVSQLTGDVPGAAPVAASLAGIEYASMAIITLAFPAAAFPVPLAGSGYLVPAIDGRAVKAATFSTVKWPHLAAAVRESAGEPMHIVRCSVGRIGEEAVLQRDDQDLIALAVADLAAATGLTGAPADARVTRWGGGLPQYAVGHLDRVSRIRTGVAGLGSAGHAGSASSLAVCGAAYDGIGVPACIASARLAAEQVAPALTA